MAKMRGDPDDGHVVRAAGAAGGCSRGQISPSGWPPWRLGGRLPQVREDQEGGTASVRISRKESLQFEPALAGEPPVRDASRTGSSSCEHRLRDPTAFPATISRSA